MTRAKNKSLRYTKEMIARRQTQSKLIRLLGFYVENIEEAEATLVNNIRLQPLFQVKPRIRSTYVLFPNRSFTDSLEAYQYAAEKVMLILQRNGRIPTIEIVIHFLKEFTVEDIKKHLIKIFRILRRNGLQAVVCIELTRTIPKIGRPNNTVHFHVLTDDKGSGHQSEEELRDLFKTACIDSGLGEKDFCINYKTITDGYWYFDYFTKFDRKSKNEKYKKTDNDRDRSWRTVLLFEKNLGLHKFYIIGKWYRISKKDLWEEIKADTAAAKAAEESNAESCNDEK